MKYTTKFLCVMAITAFFSSCASSGSGCYSFGENTKVKTDVHVNNIEIVSVGKNDHDKEDAIAICAE